MDSLQERGGGDAASEEAASARRFLSELLKALSDGRETQDGGSSSEETKFVFPRRSLSLLCLDEKTSAESEALSALHNQKALSDGEGFFSRLVAPLLRLRRRLSRAFFATDFDASGSREESLLSLLPPKESLRVEFEAFPRWGLRSAGLCVGEGRLPSAALSAPFVLAERLLPPQLRVLAGEDGGASLLRVSAGEVLSLLQVLEVWWKAVADAEDTQTPPPMPLADCAGSALLLDCRGFFSVKGDGAATSVNASTLETTFESKAGRQTLSLRSLARLAVISGSLCVVSPRAESGSRGDCKASRKASLVSLRTIQELQRALRKEAKALMAERPSAFRRETLPSPFRASLSCAPKENAEERLTPRLLAELRFRGSLPLLWAEAAALRLMSQSGRTEKALAGFVYSEGAPEASPSSERRIQTKQTSSTGTTEESQHSQGEEIRVSSPSSFSLRERRRALAGISLQFQEMPETLLRGVRVREDAGPFEVLHALLCGADLVFGGCGEWQAEQGVAFVFDVPEIEDVQQESPEEDENGSSSSSSREDALLLLERLEEEGRLGCFPQMNLRLAKYVGDTRPLGGAGQVSESRSYLHHLFAAKEMNGPSLVHLNNATCVRRLTDAFRRSSELGRAGIFVKRFVEKALTSLEAFFEEFPAKAEAAQKQRGEASVRKRPAKRSPSDASSQKLLKRASPSPESRRQSSAEASCSQPPREEPQGGRQEATENAREN